MEIAVKAVVTVDFKEMELSVGSKVQWGVLAMHFLIPAGGGEPDAGVAGCHAAAERHWTCSGGRTPTRSAPQPDELADLPALEGEADAVSGTTTNLLFVFDANEPANPELYSGNCADATYSLALETASEEPIEEAGPAGGEIGSIVVGRVAEFSEFVA